MKGSIFGSDPARKGHPQDKPKVPYARERFYKSADFDDFTHVRAAAPTWRLEVAVMRIHGTTRKKPLVVRLDSKLVRIYHRGKLLKVHQRQPRGGRATDPDDYPAELSAYTMKAPERIKRSAALHGPAVAQFAERLFDDRHPWSKIRQGHKLIRLGERYTPQRLDAACQCALSVDLIDVNRVERILVQALEQEAMPQLPLPMPAGRFARPGSVFAHAAGGRS